MIRDSDGLAHNEMFSLYNDGKKMWAGTFGGGVSCFHDNTWFTLRESDGLNSNTVGSIVSIDENNTIDILMLIKPFGKEFGIKQKFIIFRSYRKFDYDKKTISYTNTE